MNTGEHTQRITHKLFGIQFPSFPEYQSIDGGKVLCKSLRSQSHLVSLRLDLGEDSYIRRQNLSFEIREKWNGERGPEGQEKCIRRWAPERKQQICIFISSQVAVA